ncbi:UNVERIFIED_CONTAM: hypothetical protein K2H54_048083 [Gekko kuhli]
MGGQASGPEFPGRERRRSRAPPPEPVSSSHGGIIGRQRGPPGGAQLQAECAKRNLECGDMTVANLQILLIDHDQGTGAAAAVHSIQPETNLQLQLELERMRIEAHRLEREREMEMEKLRLQSQEEQRSHEMELAHLKVSQSNKIKVTLKDFAPYKEEEDLLQLRKGCYPVESDRSRPDFLPL